MPKANVDIKPGGKGDFLVSVDGRRIWDKRGKDGDFPRNEQILTALTRG